MAIDDKKDPTELNPEPELKVVLLYEDAETGLRARQSLAEVQTQGLVNGDFRPKLWRRDLLRASWLREHAALEAAGADVIIISVHGKGGLPVEVTEWLNRWLEHKTHRHCALGVLLDGLPDHKGLANQLTAYFHQLASSAGADLLWGFYGSSANTGELSSRNRAAFLPPPSSEYWGESYRRGRYSHSGINE